MRTPAGIETAPKSKDERICSSKLAGILGGPSRINNHPMNGAKTVTTSANQVAGIVARYFIQP